MRLLAALQVARRELGRPAADDPAAGVLLFGHEHTEQPGAPP